MKLKSNVPALDLLFARVEVENAGAEAHEGCMTTEYHVTAGNVLARLTHQLKASMEHLCVDIKMYATRNGENDRTSEENEIRKRCLIKEIPNLQPQNQ